MIDDVRSILLPRFHGLEGTTFSQWEHRRNRRIRCSSSFGLDEYEIKTHTTQVIQTRCLFCQRSVKNTSWDTRYSCSTQSGLHRWGRKIKGKRKKEETNYRKINYSQPRPSHGRLLAEFFFHSGRNRYHQIVQCSKACKSRATPP